MRTLFIHAGLHKTGTTSAQFSIHGHVDSLIRTVPFELPNHSVELIEMFTDDQDAGRFLDHPARRQFRRFRGRRELLLARLDEFLATNDRNGVISAEVLTDEFGPVEIDRLLTRMLLGFDRIRALIYVRPPAAFLTSFEQESVKSGQSFDPARSYPQYERRIGPWIAALGSDCVDLVDITSDDLLEGSVVVDLRHRLGMAPDLQPKRRQNASLSAEATVLSSLFWRREGPSLRSKVRTVTDLASVRGFGSHRFAIDRSVVDQIVGDNIDDVHWMEDRLGHRFSTPGPSAGSIAFASDDEIVSFAEQVEPEFRAFVRESRDLRQTSHLTMSLAKRIALRRL